MVDYKQAAQNQARRALMSTAPVHQRPFTEAEVFGRSHGTTADQDLGIFALTVAGFVGLGVLFARGLRR